VKPAASTLVAWKAIDKPKDLSIKATKGECNYRRAFIESVPREAAVALIARHLYRVCAAGGTTKYTTPRLWYAAPFR
jgi:hypothetical protein